jgi:hypothetical protein
MKIFKEMGMKKSIVLKGGLLIFIALAAASWLAACAALKPASKEYYGIPVDDRSILFVLDVSGSMEGKDEGSIKDRVTAKATGEAADAVGGAIGGTIGSFLSGAVKDETTKLSKARRELIPAVKGLSPATSFSIVTFGGDIEAWEPALVPAGQSRKTSAVVYLERLESGGGTPALKALKRAFQFAGVESIFFLSDGRPGSGTETILREVASLNSGRGVTIHTVGLGDDQDRDFLCRLARENGGVYIRNERVECGTLSP